MAFQRKELRSQRVIIQERRRKVEAYLRRGEYNHSRIAAALGVSVACVGYDIEAIYLTWKAQNEVHGYQRRQLRIKQLEGIMTQALVDYDRSKRGQEEVAWITRPCMSCAGEGEEEGAPPCKVCGGSGKIVETREAIKERDGDVAFLKVAKDCVAEIARLEGLYEKKITKTVNGKVQHQHSHAHLHAVAQPYLNASDDDLLAARTALARITGTSTNGSSH